MDFDITVKLCIYRFIADQGIAPTSSEVAQIVGSSKEEVEAAFHRLYEKKLLVPEPGDPSRIRMAPPFSGIATPFLVSSGGRSYYGNCVWDALAIPAALNQDAVVHASDAYTGEKITLEVKDQQIVPETCVIHFAVPAAFWWKDIIYT